MKIQVRKARHAHGYVITVPNRFPVFVEGPRGQRVGDYPAAFIMAAHRAHSQDWL